MKLQPVNTAATFTHVEPEFSAASMERTLLARLAADLGTPSWQEARDRGYDLQSADGRLVIEAKFGLKGARDLRSAMLQLAQTVSATPRIERALLVAALPKMGVARATEEWAQLERLFRPNLMKRLGIVAVTRDGELVQPSDATGRRVAYAARPILGGLREQPRALGHHAPTPKFFAVWSALLDAWLFREGSLRIGQIMKRAGCSHPTVTAALSRLDERREVERRTSRSAELRAFPGASFAEATSLADGLRKPIAFVDGTGKPPDAEGLLRRLARMRPPGVAVGGVAAARKYDRNFDLVGLPRLDVTAPRGQREWVHVLDPALRAARKDERAAVLVVSEPLTPMQRESTSRELPLVGPSETLLDLQDLRLGEQAMSLVTALRERKR